ncbi:MAG: HAD-IC family P-type ATPase [Clostridiales bacterium]|jgi:cation-transporting ATPase E|nr:HAD-IC family P-type ATPase [Clostridiales bacterium]
MDKTPTAPKGAKTPGRLKQVPKIVTKDTNEFAQILPADTERWIEQSDGEPQTAFADGKGRTAQSDVIDASVFDEQDAREADEDAAFFSRSSSRSRTIDSSLLSSEKIKKTKLSQRRQIVSTDFSTAMRFEPDYKTGLVSEQVEARKAKGYVNLTGRKQGKSYGTIFATNIFTFFNILVFIVAGALIVVHAKLSQLFFLLIILANIGVGIVQEIKSKRAVDKLSIMTAPTAIVIRDGERQAVPIGEVVLDDIIYLETGKQICTDCIVVKGDIEVNESMLTGESEPMKKGIGAELFSGSFVSSGSCFARAEKVGAANYVETLTSHAKRYKKPKSELTASIRLMIKFVSVFILPITAIMLYTNYRDLGPGWDAWRQNVSAVSGAVIGMIPAGMFLLVTTALFASVLRLAKKKTLVQDLNCIEMLARVDTLCLDKTGTITDGSMQVNKVIEIKGAGESAYTFNEIIGSMLTATGDNNQTAMALANYFGYSTALTPLAAVPFSSQRKLSAATFKDAGTYIFGAPEFVLKDLGVRIERIVKENASSGFRVLVLAHSPTDIAGDKLPAVRRPLCLIVIEDHIREDAPQTIKWFRENNVEVKVISGDNPVTVSEVARRVGVERAELYISLDGLSDQEVVEAAKKYTVFGRVTPEQKMLLIKSMKANGHKVAMTGDGVNDILAMREADCSVAIASGAEAARNVSHLVLQDSNFTSMPDVVKEGRRAVNNVQMASSIFLMKTFMSIVLSIIFLIIPTMKTAIYIRYPYSTDNLLLLELCIIAVPSFVLALQQNHNIIRGRFLSNVIGRCIPGGLTLVVVTMAVYYYNSYVITPSADIYDTMLTVGLTLTGLFMLAKTCEPFDAARIVLVMSIALLTAIGVFIMPESMFGIVRGAMRLQDTLYLALVVLASYFLVSILMRITRAIKWLN